MDGQLVIEGFERIYHKMEYYHKLALQTPCVLQRLQYETLMLQEVQKFMQMIQQYVNMPVSEKELTLAELAQYNGAAGKAAYVAVNGIVYDVSIEPTWGGGTHFGLYAGKDLTAQFAGCHGMQVILAKLPRVGVLVP